MTLDPLEMKREIEFKDKEIQRLVGSLRDLVGVAKLMLKTLDKASPTGKWGSPDSEGVRAVVEYIDRWCP
jgi:hypothetical protein